MSTLAPPETHSRSNTATDPVIAGSVAAIVVNFRTPDLTLSAIQHLLASQTPGYDLRVIVVDNDSGDDSVERILSRFPQVQFIVSDVNLGFAGGNNLAIDSVQRDWADNIDRQHLFVLLINSDVEVEPDAIDICLRFMREHPDVGVVGPRVTLPDGRLDLACRRGFPTPTRAFWKLTGLARRFPANPRFTGYNLTHLDENQLTEVDAVMGAFMLVRMAAIDAAGVLDDAFFMYGEDIDWAFRIKQYGWRVFYVPAARVRHLKGATTRRQSYRMIREFYRSMWLFHRKHYAKRSLFLINWLVAAGIILRGSIAIVANVMRPAGAKRVS